MSETNNSIIKRILINKAEELFRNKIKEKQKNNKEKTYTQGYQDAIEEMTSFIEYLK